MPPDDFCRGTRPIHAANCRPDLNSDASVTVAAIALAVGAPNRAYQATNGGPQLDMGRALARHNATEVRLLALLTKADKLNRRDAQAALQAAQALLGEVAPEGADIGVTLFSALSRQGLADVAEVLHGWALPS